MNSSGWKTTSKNCSGLRRIFLVARQAMVMVWLTVSAGLTRWVTSHVAPGSATTPSKW